MQKFFLFILFLPAFLFFTECQKIESGNNEEDKTYTKPQKTKYLSINYETVTVPEITFFNMGYTGIETPHTVPLISSFKMGKYEVTYDQWYLVKQWAVNNGYVFKNPGNEGISGQSGAPTSRKNEPVSNVSWRDCIVWCNAASDTEGLQCVYFQDSSFSNPIKDSSHDSVIDTTPGSCDNPYVDWSSNGYRLPTEAEWEACARYIDGSTWLRGDVPSGWVDNNPADGNWRIEAGSNWLDDNTGDNYDEVDAVAWWVSINAISHDVGTKNGNMLNIYDMSGNIEEWCWDWNDSYTTSSPYTDNNPKGPTTGTTRIYRGGASNLSFGSYYLRTSYRDAYFPYSGVSYTGFRAARSIP